MPLNIMLGVNYYVMSYNINKVSLNYQKYNKLLSFSKKNDSILFIKGFFGLSELKIPKNIIVEIDNNNSINLYFNSNKLSTIGKILKSFYFSIIFSIYGLVFNHFVDMNIKGIGYKFELKGNNEILVYSGNSLPTNFEIPENLIILDNSNTNNFSVLGNDYVFLNNFVNKIKNIAVPNKYKEIGIFLEKRL